MSLRDELVRFPHCTCRLRDLLSDERWDGHHDRHCETLDALLPAIERHVAAEVAKAREVTDAQVEVGARAGYEQNRSTMARPSMWRPWDELPAEYQEKSRATARAVLTAAREVTP